MSKNYFKLRTVAMIISCLATMTAFTACNDDDKDDGNNDGGNATPQTAIYTGTASDGKLYTLTISPNAENTLRSSSSYTPQAGDRYVFTDGMNVNTGEVKTYENYIMILVSGLCARQEFQITIAGSGISVIIGTVEWMDEDVCLAEAFNNKALTPGNGNNNGGNNNGGNGDNGGGGNNGDGGDTGDNCGILTLQGLPEAITNSEDVTIMIYDYAGTVTSSVQYQQGALASPYISVGGEPMGNGRMLMSDISGIGGGNVTQLPTFTRNGTYAVSVQVLGTIRDFYGDIQNDFPIQRIFHQVQFSCGAATINWNTPSYDRMSEMPYNEVIYPN
ncbi:MAG: hypothetical protein LBR81_09805 [Prevotellaceae bacterium]|jgi:hypothetical protein|nr:hypothetical protein [Prevotellaceae bacterium]